MMRLCRCFSSEGSSGIEFRSVEVAAYSAWIGIDSMLPPIFAPVSNYLLMLTSRLSILLLRTLGKIGIASFALTILSLSLKTRSS